MKNKETRFVLVCFVGFFGVCALVFLIQDNMSDEGLNQENQPRVARLEDSLQQAKTGSLQAQPDEPPHAGWVKIGGVWRPPSDVSATNKPLKDGARPRAPLPDPGRSPLISADKSPQSRAIARTLRTGENPERVNLFRSPPAFNEVAFLDDPEHYLGDHVPGRAFQNAPAGQGVEPLKRMGPYYQKVLQDETVVLRALGKPGMPVSFYSPRLGIFEESGTSAVSVRADEDGIATVRFTASAGAHGDTPVLAASPVNSGQTKFIVHIQLPDRLAVH